MLLPSGTLLGAGDWLSQLLFGGGVGLNGGPGNRQVKLASPKGGDGPCQSGSSSWKKSGWTEISGWIPAPSCSLQQLGTCGTVWDSSAVGSSVRTVDAPVLLVPWLMMQSGALGCAVPSRLPFFIQKLHRCCPGHRQKLWCHCSCSSTPCM